MAQPDAIRLDAWRSLLRAHAALTESLGRELQAQRGMSLPAYEVLLHLSEARGRRIRMRDLAASVLLSRSGLTRLVDRLESAGLVRREQAEDDGRGAFACLTSAGRSALRRAAPVHLRGVDERFGRHLDDEEAVVTARALDRVATASGR